MVSVVIFDLLLALVKVNRVRAHIVQEMCECDTKSSARFPSTTSDVLVTLTYPRVIGRFCVKRRTGGETRTESMEKESARIVN
jgi:hypothetical protein